MGTIDQLFPELGKGGKKKIPPYTKPMEGHIWTASKSKLIDEYIHRFLLVTKHGAYVDLFAGPQRETFSDDWSVKRVLERRSPDSPSLRYYAVCDANPSQVARLETLSRLHSHKPHQFKIYDGDANEQIEAMLDDLPDVPTFCLIDQRTLECRWETVRKVALHKDQYKIEIFYFLAQAWLDRSWKSTKDAERLHSWWGRDDYKDFIHLGSVYRAQAFCSRFKMELGYAYVHPFSIHEKGEDSKTMYYMIHASDHPRAPVFMSEAYNHVRRETAGGIEQLSFLK